MEKFFSKFKPDDREPDFLTFVKIVFLAITIVFGLFLFVVSVVLTYGWSLLLVILAMLAYILMNSTT